MFELRRLTLLSRSCAAGLSETATGELLNALLLVGLALCALNSLPLPALDGNPWLLGRFDSLQETRAAHSFVLILILLNIGVIREYLFTLPARGPSGLAAGLFDQTCDA